MYLKLQAKKKKTFSRKKNVKGTKLKSKIIVKRKKRPEKE